ncbi:MAG: hypothetical protein QXX12_08130 [Nanopusillaceae archaeon]
MKILYKILDEVYPTKENGTSAKLGITIGLMGSGKTTFSKVLSKVFKDKYGEAYVIWFKSTQDFLYFMDMCDGLSSKNLFFVLDDVSFYLFGVTQHTRNFLSEFFKIRHYCRKAEKIFTMFIVHYSKSINRFLRGAHLKVLTSFDPVEFKNLSELFPESDLVDYYEYYLKHYEDKFIYLIRTPIHSYIVDFTLDKEILEQLSYSPKSTTALNF